MTPPNIEQYPLGFVCNDAGQVLSFRDATGYLRVYTYDEEGRLLTTLTETGYTSEFHHGPGVKTWSNSLGWRAAWAIDAEQEDA